MNEPTKLVNLSGAPKKNLSPEIANINLLELDDAGAGLVFLRMVEDTFPGITMKQLATINENHEMGFIGKLWRKTKNAVGDIYDGGKTFIGDVVKGSGDVGGSIVRLAADEDVSNAIARGGMAYASGGSSEGIMGILSAFGKSAKQTAAKNPMLLYGAIGIGALFLIVLAVKE